MGVNPCDRAADLRRGSQYQEPQSSVAEYASDGACWEDTGDNRGWEAWDRYCEGKSNIDSRLVAKLLNEGFVCRSRRRLT